MIIHISCNIHVYALYTMQLGGCVLQSNCYHMQRSHCHRFMLFQTGADYKLQLNSICHQVTIIHVEVLKCFWKKSKSTGFISSSLCCCNSFGELLYHSFSNWRTGEHASFSIFLARSLSQFKFIWFENPPTKHKTKSRIFAAKMLLIELSESDMIFVNFFTPAHFQNLPQKSA